MDKGHGWTMRSASNQSTELSGACPAVVTRIGDVHIPQHFFVQESASYDVILGQPYITASRMETKVMEDGAHYARIRSLDGKMAVQFLTICAGHERNRIKLRISSPIQPKEFGDF